MATYDKVFEIGHVMTHTIGGIPSHAHAEEVAKGVRANWVNEPNWKYELVGIEATSTQGDYVVKFTLTKIDRTAPQHLIPKSTEPSDIVAAAYPYFKVVSEYPYDDKGRVAVVMQHRNPVGAAKRQTVIVNGTEIEGIE